MWYCRCQALVRSLNYTAASRLPSQQSLKTSPTSLIDTFCRVSLPSSSSTVGLSSGLADDSRLMLPTSLDLTAARSSQSVTYSTATPGYFVCSPAYLSPTGSTETVALRELQAFAGRSGIDHVATQSPDTTDSASSQGYAETSGIIQSTSSVATDDRGHSLREPKSVPSPSVCTTCGRGCGCHQQSEDTVYQRLSQDSTSSWHSSSLAAETVLATQEVHDCRCPPHSSSPSAFLSSTSPSSPQHQHLRQQSQHSDITVDLDLFSTLPELSKTLRELSMAAREPPTRNTADLIEHTIQAVVDAHVSTCLYTTDKVATGLREYELKLSTKPPVTSSFCLIIV